MDLHSRLQCKHNAEELGGSLETIVPIHVGSGPWAVDNGTEFGNRKPEISAPQSLMPDPSPLIPPIILDLSPAPHASLFSLQSPLGSFLFSYTTSAVLLGIAALIGWAWKVSNDQQVAQSTPASVGQVANLSNRPGSAERGHRWSPASPAWSIASGPIPTPRRSVSTGYPLGRKYALASGFMEITYDTGAKVILQGPCTYEVESTTGGYLSLGKLTARVDAVAKSQVPSPKTQVPNPSSLIPHPSSLFSVRTPTAIVTDLGTEFGVEVAKSGATKSHVFRGKVELRPANVERNSFRSTAPKAQRNEFRSTESDDNRPIQLGENESATVEAGQDRPIMVIHKSQSIESHSRLCGRMPGAIPIKLFNTGVGLKEHDADPHWQIVAIRDDPRFWKFKPLPLYVVSFPVGADRVFLQTTASRSQWVCCLFLKATAQLKEAPSAAGGPLPDLSALSPEATSTFQSTFDLAGMSPERAIVRGRFLIGTNVVAIRLNGRNLHCPSMKARTTTIGPRSRPSVGSSKGPTFWNSTC